METYEQLREKAGIPEAQLRARCQHLEAGLKVIAAGAGSPMLSIADADSEISAVEAFAQSTLDEAPPADGFEESDPAGVAIARDRGMSIPERRLRRWLFDQMQLKYRFEAHVAERDTEDYLNAYYRVCG